MFSMYCTSCLDGYSLKNKACIKNVCGRFCSLCYTQDTTPICIACNKSALLQLISTITGYIKDFYGITDLELRSLENFNTSKDDCFLCPLGCNGCDQNTISSDPF